MILKNFKFLKLNLLNHNLILKYSTSNQIINNNLTKKKENLKIIRTQPTWTSGSNFNDKSDQLYLYNSFTKKKVNF
jgi:hypothetical protein